MKKRYRYEDLAIIEDVKTDDTSSNVKTEEVKLQSSTKHNNDLTKKEQRKAAKAEREEAVLEAEPTKTKEETKIVSNEDFRLVGAEHQETGEEIKTKQHGYYADVWRRFTKNRVSLVAFIILSILVIMTIVGPYLNSHEIRIDAEETNISYMPPKIKGFEKMPIFNGRKYIKGRAIYRFVEDINADPVVIKKDMESFVIKIKNVYVPAEEKHQTRVLKFKGKDIIVSPRATADVQVDYYKWVNYNQSYGDEKKQQISYVLYEKILEHDAKAAADDKIIIDVQSANKESGVCYVQMNYFKFLKHIKGIDASSFAFGSDGRGRDLFTAIWEGSRVSLLLALIVSTVNIIIGIIVGSIAGYFGGTVDLVIERISEIIAGIPFMALLTILLLRFGQSFFIIVIAFTLTGWLGIAGLTRMQFYRYKNREYVLAARTLGAKDFRIMFKHIFPSTVGTLITSLVLYIPSIIFTESTFAFLGIIQYGDTVSIGQLISNGQDVMKTDVHLLIFPAIYISILMLSFNMIGNGLRDAFNPTLRGVE